MAGIIKWIDKKCYKNFRNNWDDDIFRDLTLKYLNASDTFLDLGAGRGALPQMNFKGLCKVAYGVDPEDIVMQNPFLDHAYVGIGDSMPFFKDEMFDVITSNNVLEHIESPDAFFSEVKRILKPGGIFITKTPNKYYFIMLLSSVLPTSFHKFYNKLRGRNAIDTFPTYYKVNSVGAVKQIAKKHHLTIQELFFFEGRPEYLRISAITYLFGLAYERLVNLLKLERMKICMYTVYKKSQVDGK